MKSTHTQEHQQQSGDDYDFSPDQFSAFVKIVGASHVIPVKQHGGITEQPNDFQDLYKILHQNPLLSAISLIACEEREIRP